MVNLGGKIKEARVARGASRRKMVVALDNAGVRITEKTLGNWEKNKTTPDAHQIKAIADMLGYDLGYFFVPIDNTKLVSK